MESYPHYGFGAPVVMILCVIIAIIISILVFISTFYSIILDKLQKTKTTPSKVSSRVLGRFKHFPVLCYTEDILSAAES